MAGLSSPRRMLISHAPPTAFDPMTRPILARLGYAIVDFEDLTEDAPCRPDLRIVDERNLADVDEGDEPAVPLVVLTGRYGVTGVDPRIAAALRRPVGMHELYRVAQQLLEDTPRGTPRVALHRRARCRRDGREWAATLLSLSENGCLIRSPEPVPMGVTIGLSFRLPRAGLLSLEAEVAYQLPPDLGLVFNAVASELRGQLADFVERALAADTEWPPEGQASGVG